MDLGPSCLAQDDCISGSSVTSEKAISQMFMCPRRTFLSVGAGEVAPGHDSAHSPRFHTAALVAVW